jgi:hypothetical protein
MSELMVRCIRCHEVFDAEAGPCTKCGTPYSPPRAAPPLPDTAFVDRYAGTDFVPAAPAPLVAPIITRRRNNTTLLIGGGVALIICALVVGTLISLGAMGGSTPTQGAFIVPVASRPTPTATLPPTIQLTMDQLNDLKLTAHVTIESRIQQNTITATRLDVVKFDGEISGGDQWGVFDSQGATTASRFINGKVEYKPLPGGKWTPTAAMPSYMVLCPLFGINSTQDLQFIGRETLNGHLVNHLQSTDWWRADTSRLALADLTDMVPKPDTFLLDLYVNADGTPVAATFSATNSATNGTKLIDIRASYTFSDVGVPASPPADIPAPSVSASPAS